MGQTPRCTHLPVEFLAWGSLRKSRERGEGGRQGQSRGGSECGSQSRLLVARNTCHHTFAFLLLVFLVVSQVKIVVQRIAIQLLPLLSSDHKIKLASDIQDPRKKGG